MDHRTAVETLRIHQPTPWWRGPRRCRHCEQEWMCDEALLANATLNPPDVADPPDWHLGRPR